MSNRFETFFDGNKWLVTDKDNNTLLGGFASAKLLNEFVDKISDLETKFSETEESARAVIEAHFRVIEARDKLKQQLADMTEKYNACQEARKLESEFSQQDKKELIQQLAEKRQDCVALDKAWNNVNNQLSVKDDEIKELKQKLTESEASHEILINQFEEETEKLRKQIKQESDARKRFVEEVKSLKKQLTESEKKLNQYQYKNDVIEKQYEELKNGIKFRIENNITDDWEQHYHCIDVLCEKHKARIRDIENGICAIEELKKKLSEKDNSFEWLHNKYAKHIETCNQDKISFAIEKLEKVKETFTWGKDNGYLTLNNAVNIIDQLIKEAKGE